MSNLRCSDLELGGVQFAPLHCDFNVLERIGA